MEAVKAVRYQLPEILDALSALREYAEEKQDSERASDANSIHKEMKKWPFLVSTVVWYEVLFHINKVSKLLERGPCSDSISERLSRGRIQLC